MYQVHVTTGGPVSGMHLREEYVPGVTYTFDSSDQAYVKGLGGRFQVTEIPDPEPAPADPASEGSEGNSPAATASEGSVKATAGAKANKGNA